MKYIKLNNGNEIPMLGFGTFKMKDENILEDVITSAYEAGYRLIDTAFVYKNEAIIGGILKKLGIRSELVIATKVFPCDFGREATKKSIDRSLHDLGTDRIDLMYLHWPADDMVDSYHVLEDFYRQGVIDNIGVSNFTPSHIQQILENCDIKPQCNQIEIHPLLSQEEEVSLLQSQDIQPVAWSPLFRAREELFQSPLLLQLCEKYHKTAAQIILRWDLERGLVTIPKSNHPDRIRENFDIFNFSLTREEIQNINALNENKRSGSSPYDEEFLKSNRYGDRWKGI